MILLLDHDLRPHESLYSYIVQHFNDTFRQSIIDLMLGNITNCNQLQEDDALKTILSITESSIKVPEGYHTYGALNPEIQLAESIITSSRFAIRNSPNRLIRNGFHCTRYLVEMFGDLKTF